MDTPIVTQPTRPSYTNPAPSGTTLSVPTRGEVSRDIAFLGCQEEVRVYQELDKWDAAFLKTNFDRYNTYVICNEVDQAAYFAKESSETLWRICLQQRPMTVDIKDDYGTLVMRLNRPYRCKAGWLCCCHLQEMSIERPQGTLMASVAEKWTSWRPEFEVCVSGSVRYLVRGAWTAHRCSSHIRFHVYDSSRHKVAVIYKLVANCTERCAFLNDFRVKYLSPYLSAEDRLVILGAAFLVDFNYLEIRV